MTNSHQTWQNSVQLRALFIVNLTIYDFLPSQRIFKIFMFLTAVNHVDTCQPITGDQDGMQNVALVMGYLSAKFQVRQLNPLGDISG